MEFKIEELDKTSILDEKIFNNNTINNNLQVYSSMVA